VNMETSRSWRWRTIVFAGHAVVMAGPVISAALSDAAAQPALLVGPAHPTAIVNKRLNENHASKDNQTDADAAPDEASGRTAAFATPGLKGLEDHPDLNSINGPVDSSGPPQPSHNSDHAAVTSELIRAPAARVTGARNNIKTGKRHAGYGKASHTVAARKTPPMHVGAHAAASGTQASKKRLNNNARYHRRGRPGRSLDDKGESSGLLEGVLSFLLGAGR
jgi:hypothetical protein